MTYARRIERLEALTTHGPHLRAEIERVAAAAGIHPEELRHEAERLAERYAGLAPEAMIEALAADEGIPPEELRAAAAAIEEAIE